MKIGSRMEIAGVFVMALAFAGCSGGESETSAPPAADAPAAPTASAPDRAEPQVVGTERQAVGTKRQVVGAEPPVVEWPTFVDALGACAPAVTAATRTRTAFGFQEVELYELTIVGPRNGTCSVAFALEHADLVAPEATRRQLTKQGNSPEDIERALAGSRERVRERVGRRGTCQLPTRDARGILQQWHAGQAGLRARARCSGPLFSN